MSGAGELQKAAQEPGTEEQRQRDEAGRSGKFPNRRAEGDPIEGDENCAGRLTEKTNVANRSAWDLVSSAKDRSTALTTKVATKA